MNRTIQLAAIVISTVACAGLSNVMAAEITVSEDRADFVLTPETFPYSGGTLDNLQSDSDNIELVSQTGLKQFYTGVYTTWLDGNSYAISGYEDFDVNFSTPQTAFAMVYADHSDESLFTLTFYNVVGDKETKVITAELTQFTTTEFGAAKFVGFISDAPFNKVEIREISDANTNEYFQFYTAVANGAPTAVAGSDQSIRVSDTVILDGSASFDDNTASTALEYRWNFVSKPDGSTAMLVDANSPMPSFTVDVAGTYEVNLSVTDENGKTSSPATVMISSDNLAPTAAAGDDELVMTGTATQCDASGSSDPENDVLTFEWTIVSAPPGSTATLSNPYAKTASLTPDLEGVYEISLTVSDFIGAGAPDLVKVTAISALDYAEYQILSAHDMVGLLESSQVTNKGNRNSFQEHLTNAIKELRKGKVDKAIADLQKAMDRSDGCMLRGFADGEGNRRDHITHCGAQADVYGLLDGALNALLAQ